MYDKDYPYSFSGYFLTAYGIAVKHGFQGTEEEWLEYLKAGEIEMKYEDGHLYYKTTKEEEWHVLSEFDNVSTDLTELAETLTKSAETANALVTESESTLGTVQSTLDSATSELEALKKDNAAIEVWEDYNPQTPYLPLNKVVFNGSSYACKKECTGIDPTNTEYWTLIASKGVKGDRGEQGPQGNTGEPGPEGPAGPQGLQGEKGEQGEQGPKGETGSKGDTGDTGPQGIQGPEGPQGPKGDQGEPGPKGDQGPQGEPGPQGEQGPQGEKGDTGTGLDILGTYDTLEELKSAVPSPTQGQMYNVGTEAPYTIYMWDTTTPPGDWISQGKLQGPQGEQGLPGEKGDKGDKGDTGATGIQGPAGAKGDPGEAATIELGSVTTGDPGSEAQVTNSGTSSAAVFNFVIPRGEQGIQGDQGPKGDTGPQGEKGDTGDQGPKGDTGDQGPKGDTGPAGENATINGVSAITINATNGLQGSMSDSTYTLSGEGLIPKEKVLTFGAQTVESATWAPDSSYSGYGFKANVPLSGVTADYFAYVAFGAAEAVGGKLAPFCDTYEGGVSIYATEQPGETINIGSILCTKG